MLERLRSKPAQIFVAIALVVTAWGLRKSAAYWAHPNTCSYFGSLSIWIAGFALFLCWLLTPVAMKVAHRVGCLDIPDERKRHPHPTPLLGGVAILVATGVALLLAEPPEGPVRGILFGSLLIVAVGVVDDARGLSAATRLVCQIAAASIVMSHGVVLSFLPDAWWGRVGEVVLTLLWIVGITNALNFLDGIDGLAAGLAAIDSTSFLIIAHGMGHGELMHLLAALLGACMGFLVFNFKPAVIFLGDAGSTFLGFFLACTAVLGTYAERDSVIALAIPVLVLGIIIYDVIFITFSRIHRGVVTNVKEWLEYTGHDHLHHRLQHLGLSDVQTVLFIYVLSAFMSIGAIVLVAKTNIDKYLVMLMALIMFGIITVLMELGRMQRDVNANETSLDHAQTEARKDDRRCGD